MNWQNQTIKYSEFAKRLETPIRTDETYAEYLALSKSEQNKLKDVGGFVGGELRGGRRKSCNVVSRDLITLDFDNIKAYGSNDIVEKVIALSCAAVIYSTRKHSEVTPRLRVVIPTDRPMMVDEYEPVSRMIASKIELNAADPTTFEASRLMYWPSCSKDSLFVYANFKKEFLRVDSVLSEYEDWRDVSQWPIIPGQNARIKKSLVKQANPTEKSGIVGAFCKVYDIRTAIDKFIPQAYTESADGRLTYLEGSTVGGAVLYQNDTFLYSHHATDPCSGTLVNAWDLIRLHRFGELDSEAAPNTPSVSLPSYVAMRELARDDEAVMELIAKEQQAKAGEFFTALDQQGAAPQVEESFEWRKMLSTDKKGKIEKTIANIVTVLSFDSNYKNKIFIDEFANRGMVQGPMPWDSSDEVRLWSDYDDAQLTLRLEKEFNLTGKDKIENAIKVVGHNNRRNAVKDFLTSLKWDGVNRIDTLLSDYLGAKQNVYTAAVMRKSLSAAVGRAISNKGLKFDNMVVFTGRQGIGKSTFLSKLGKDWFSDSLYNFEGKEAAELIQGTLINEVGELSALNKSETEAVKQFLSKTHDIYREAYGRRTNKYPRRCVFYGSTNSDSFLKDPTGNRRFWPVSVGVVPTKKSVFKDLDYEVDQIWAEAYMLYVLGEPLYLEGEALKIAEEQQNIYRDTDPWEYEIASYLDRTIPKNWYSLGVNEQRGYMHGTFACKNDVELVERDVVCIKDIWQVCFNGDARSCGESGGR